MSFRLNTANRKEIKINAQFVSLSEQDHSKKVNGEDKFLRKPCSVGMEIEQPAMGNGPIKPIIVNDNPTNLPIYVPEAVKARSSIYGGHWDGSKPWEWQTPHSSQEIEILRIFNQVVGTDQWVWAKEFYFNNERRGCGSHIHWSVRGELDLGDSFDHQRVGNANLWAILFNDMMTWQPLTAIFWSFGKRFRNSALTQWAIPVVARVEPSNIIELFSTGTTTTTKGNHTTLTMGHPYSALAWNRHTKRAVTIENRLVENHPYWTLPAVQLFGVFNNACMLRNESIKLKDWNVRIPEFWDLLRNYDIYKAMALMKKIEFVEGRGIPYLCGGAKKKGSDKDGDDKIYSTALDLFRMMCRRFMKTKMESPLKFGKVMQMYSDFIDLEKVPANLIWDIDELYRRLYVDDEAERYQDAYLYFGHEVVIPPNGRYRKINWETFVRGY